MISITLARLESQLAPRYVARTVHIRGGLRITFNQTRTIRGGGSPAGVPCVRVTLEYKDCALIKQYTADCGPQDKKAFDQYLDEHVKNHIDAMHQLVTRRSEGGILRGGVDDTMRIEES